MRPNREVRNVNCRLPPYERRTGVDELKNYLNNA
jgi:hypothetical protein